jgi:hypothetical protein
MSIREDERLGAKRFEIYRNTYASHERSKCQCFARDSSALDSIYSVANAQPCVVAERELVCTLSGAQASGSFNRSARIALNGARRMCDTRHLAANHRQIIHSFIHCLSEWW